MTDFIAYLKEPGEKKSIILSKFYVFEVAMSQNKTGVLKEFKDVDSEDGLEIFDKVHCKP